MSNNTSIALVIAAGAVLLLDLIAVIYCVYVYRKIQRSMDKVYSEWTLTRFRIRQLMTIMEKELKQTVEQMARKN